MSLVLDASILVAATLDTGDSGVWAEQIVLNDGLFAPELSIAEAGDIFRRFERTGEISSLEASSAYQDIVALNIRLVGFLPFADRVWELRHNLSTYDAWYVALAESMHLPLATLDRKMSQACGPTCRFLLP